MREEYVLNYVKTEQTEKKLNRLEASFTSLNQEIRNIAMMVTKKNIG